MQVKKLVGVFTALAIALMTAVIAIPSASASSVDVQFANRLQVLINDYRKQHALPPLRSDPQMTAASQSWTQQSADIANTSGAGTFVHSPGSYAFHENIVWNMSADAAFNSWVQSAPHRANMLIAGATDMGIGAVQLTAGPNKGTFLATAQFGWSNTPVVAPAAPVQKPVAVPVQKPVAAPVQKPVAAPVQKPAATPAAPIQKPVVSSPAPAKDEKAAAEKAAADKAAAEKAAADKAAAEKAAADKAAAEKAAAEKAAADKAAADKAAADKAAADKAVADKAAADVAAADKAAAEKAAADAASKAVEEEAASADATDESARQAAEQQAAAAKASEELAATQAAEQAAAQAAEQAAAEKAAADEAAAASESAVTFAAARGGSRALQGAAVPVLSSMEQVVLGNESLLTSAARGTVTANAAGSQLNISGLQPGTGVEIVIPAAGVNLGAMTVDADGGLRVSVPPVLAAGEHKVALFKDGGLTGWASFTVEPAVTVLAAKPVPAEAGTELAVTGLNAAQVTIGGIGALMTLTGAAALIAVQRQRSVSAR